MKYTNFLLVLILTFLTVGCSSDNDVFEQKIKKYCSDSLITEEEYNEIKDLLIENKRNLVKNYENFYEKGALNENNIRNFINNYNKTTIAFWDSGIDNYVKCNIFLENSGSMVGYYNGATNLKKVVYNLVVDIGYLYDSISRFTINNQSYQMYDSIENFVQGLNNNKIKNGGNILSQASSKFERIFYDFLNSDFENNINILISDCAYSVNNQDPEAYLNGCEALIKNYFLSNLKKNEIKTILLKYNSEFRGKCYHYDRVYKREKSTELDNVRPYYIWIVGNTENINELIENINLLNSENFENYFVFTSLNTIKINNYVLDNTYKIGDFRKDRDNNYKLTKVEKSDRGDTKGDFQFVFLADLSEIQISDEYLLNSKNYLIASKDSFSLEILNIDDIKLHQNDKSKIKDSFTHLFKVKTSDITNVEQSLDIFLKIVKPDWVDLSSSKNELDACNSTDKTFGFSYLFDGVFNAYLLHNDIKEKYFSIKITSLILSKN